jgi:hypothetical protein
VLQEQLAFLAHDLETANAGLVFPDLVDGIETLTSIRAEVITWVKILVSGLCVSACRVRSVLHKGYAHLEEMLRRSVEAARTQPAEVHISAPSPGLGSDGGSSSSPPLPTWMKAVTRNKMTNTASSAVRIRLTVWEETQLFTRCQVEAWGASPLSSAPS